jgi:hypothetical protein
VKVAAHKLAKPAGQLCVAAALIASPSVGATKLMKRSVCALSGRSRPMTFYIHRDATGVREVNFMSNDPGPLKYVGTQSQETMNLEDALARDAARKEAARNDAESGAAHASSALHDATRWALAKTEEGSRAALRQVGRRTTAALESQTRKDPIRASSLRPAWVRS